MNVQYSQGATSQFLDEELVRVTTQGAVKRPAQQLDLKWQISLRGYQHLLERALH